jgi:pyruvate dehydrogenase E2 component (dihydrolipoamide acetyltransferase)
MTAFKLPDLGEGLQQAEIVAWHVAEGDHVVADQPLLAVETEKAVVEIPSPRAGRVSRLLVRPGDHVAVGAPVLDFEEAPHSDSGTVVGTLPDAKRAAPKTDSAPEAAAMPPSGIRAAPAVGGRARPRGRVVAHR